MPEEDVVSEMPWRPVESRDPRSGEVWREFTAATGDNVAAVARARTAQPAWAALPAGRRLDALRRFHDLLYAHRHEISALVGRETGKQGVIASISLWNYPSMLASTRILPAVATGNAAVFKPSQLTPSVGEAAARLLVDAGVPDGVIRVVQGDGATGAALTAAPLDKEFFTGSVRAAHGDCRRA